MERNKNGCSPRFCPWSPFFNIFINDIFINLDQSKLCNYADDNTLWIGGSDKEDISAKLQHEMNIIDNGL